jgi:hypothetical protein
VDKLGKGEKVIHNLLPNFECHLIKDKKGVVSHAPLSPKEGRVTRPSFREANRLKQRRRIV